MSTLKRIHKNTVKALLRRGKVFTGYLAPNNVNGYHINSGWHIGHKTTILSLEMLEQRIQDYAIYNCNSELGNRVVLWLEAINGDMILNNLKREKITEYAREEAYKLLTYGISKEQFKIVKLHRGFAVSLILNLEDTNRSERPVYDYSVCTPDFEVWKWNAEEKAYDIEEHKGVIFQNGDFAPSPFSLKSDEKIIDDLLEWICLRIGDTDQSYFDGYDPAQIAWAKSETCANMQIELDD